jgi:multidrug resistance efflux pump
MIIGKGRTEILGDGSVSWAKTPPQDIERDRRSTGAGRRAGDRRASRLARLLAAIAVAIAGTAALVGEQVHVVSNNAVVSSARILIRTPIDGIVTMAPPALGSALAEGAVLARIENPRLSPRRIEELRAELAQVTATEAATRRRRETVAALRTELADRAARHASLVATRVQADIDSAVAVFAGRVAQRDQAWRDLTRRRALATVGVASKADLERAELLFANASLDTAGQAAALRALKVQLDAARQTIFAEQGANDVGYSRQRAGGRARGKSGAAAHRAKRIRAGS